MQKKISLEQITIGADMCQRQLRATKEMECGASPLNQNQNQSGTVQANSVGYNSGNSKGNNGGGKKGKGGGVWTGAGAGQELK